MSESPVQVRRAGGADVALVAPLFALYHRFYGKPYDEQIAAGFLRERLERAESVVLLAELDGPDGPRPVGFTQLYPGFSSVSAAPVWTLNDLYVLDSARDTGAGAALMESAERLARQAGAVALKLETARDNTVAQRLYQRQSYQLEDGYPHYRKTRLPALPEDTDLTVPLADRL